jgi:two-component system, cell cycle response regulator
MVDALKEKAEAPNVERMSPVSIWLRRVAIPAAVILLGGATIALGAMAGLGAWLVAVVGGSLLGALATVIALAISGASTGTLAPQLQHKVDPMTGLPSAQRLQESLEAALADDRPAAHWLFVYVLEGLKRYDDAYGEQPGDALLQWLGRRLRDAVGDRGTVYRMRGGSFAVLAPGPERTASAVRVDASTALFEVGDGFTVWSTVGEVALPEQTVSAEEAIALADRRARSQRGNPNTVSHLRPPDEPFSDVSLDRSHQEVGQLARAVGKRLGLDATELDALEAAAQLRDVGNVALPSSVFIHPGSLPGHEWEFIRLHTVVGERLLDGRFGMSEEARIVRSSHERWDGAGYPDGLSGQRIPLASRIVFVCSAYEDMRAERPHRAALSESAALEELRKNAGTQFDPQVVGAFDEELAAHRVPLRLTG